MAITTTTAPPARRPAVDLARGFLTGGVWGTGVAAFVVGLGIGRAPLIVAGVGLPVVHGLLVFLAGVPRRRREAAVAPRTALAAVESLEVLESEDGGVPVRFDLTVAPDGAPAYRVETRQEIDRVDLGAYRPNVVLVVEYPPDRPWQVRIVKRPTPEWEERAAEARIDSAPGPALASDPPGGGAAGFAAFLGLLLGAAAVVLLFRAEMFDQGGAGRPLHEGAGAGHLGWHGYLALGCAVLGTVALLGYGLSLAGMTRAQRTVRLTGRIERVREPRHGGSGKGGVPVVVSYRGPSGGQEVIVTNDGDRGEMITAAWTGREIGVHYPRGRPHAFRFTDRPRENGRGLGVPNSALFLIYVGIVVAAAIDRGWPWALIGLCGPWAVYGAFHLPGNIRDKRRRSETLASMVAVRGRVVAVLKDVGTDGEGSTSTTLTPVIAFTTREGTAVTALVTRRMPDSAGARGRELTVHYAPADPAVLTLDHAADQRSLRTDIVVNVAALLTIASAAVAGAVML
ncbi:DUF3592 domain-containing protein [Actinomadura sp. WMMA1423]|uniref:DUF3592 domain-containing protein n=1 Tax=Actinomadura sp. WMMA1423 TaxID=2591108 RepID=UPI00197AB1CA|nr:DUF3592 domain-containing protein [Actinomadura sp. WMMA1423]